MQLKQITKLSRLYKNDLRSIKNLVDLCMQHDQYRIKLYWSALQNRLTQELNDIFYFVNGNLVGYLALFTFETDESEISILVHPKYRRGGIYKKLLAEALLELTQRNIPKLLFVCPQKSPINKQYLAAFHPEYVFSQIEMMATKIPIFANLPGIYLRPVKITDLPTIAQLGVNCFKASYEETFGRFAENLREKNRRIWLLSTSEHPNIGKIHVRYDENYTAFIHDLCVLPEYRGKKYALAMIIQLMQMLYKEGQRVFTLDVEYDNEGALKLYELCGFQKVSSYDFWRVLRSDILI